MNKNLLLKQNRLTILSGPTESGKTTTAMAAVINTLFDQQRSEANVLVFSYEMKTKHYLKGLACIYAGIEFEHFADTETKEDATRLRVAAEATRNAPLCIIESCPDVDKLCSHISDATQKAKYSLIVIDYLQLIKQSSTQHSMQVHRDETVWRLSELATKTSTPIVLIRQRAKALSTPEHICAEHKLSNVNYQEIDSLRDNLIK